MDELGPYVLVILRRGSRFAEAPLHAPAHERFISNLIKRNVILLGGELEEPVGEAAYVLRRTLEEARAIADADPFVEHDVMRPACVEWRLVGINPDAIDDAAVIRPADI
jgi:uncharacterized protein YciI